ncbi:hypothetical protein V5D56_00635 [Cellulosimicrobium sp. PMB13]|uniref:hypothetical protein n=1 Tax=Cellulosimicrobium sp. PMB13 TaxID=3120158 RepID=UPI003F4C14BE
MTEGTCPDERTAAAAASVGAVIAWGDVPNWIAALAALVAVVFAWLAAAHTRGLLRREADRDELTQEREMARRRQERRAQADLVGAWIACRVRLTGGEEVLEEYGLVIRNASHAPVFDVALETTGYDGAPQRTLTLAVLPPGEYYAPTTDDPWFWGLPDPKDAVVGIVRPVMRRKERHVTEIRFRDSAGHRWVRDVHGNLRAEQVSAPDASAPGTAR